MKVQMRVLAQMKVYKGSESDTRVAQNMVKHLVKEMDQEAIQRW